MPHTQNDAVGVHRTRILPTGPAEGKLLVPLAVKAATLSALRAFRGLDGRHEGLVLWAGRWIDGVAMVMSAIVPESEHGPGSVIVHERAYGRASRWAREHRLLIVAQVHSHPGADTRHSDGDDDLILMAREGLFSLVIPNYGDGGITPADGASLHQYQGRRWVLVSRDSPESIVVVPPLVGTRS